MEDFKIVFELDSEKESVALAQNLVKELNGTKAFKENKFELEKRPLTSEDASAEALIGSVLVTLASSEKAQEYITSIIQKAIDWWSDLNKTKYQGKYNKKVKVNFTGKDQETISIELEGEISEKNMDKLVKSVTEKIAKKKK